jgi:hypothetical protein
MGINPMNKITIIIRILFVVTLFQQKPQTKTQFGRRRMSERVRGEVSLL